MCHCCRVTDPEVTAMAKRISEAAAEVAVVEKLAVKDHCWAGAGTTDLCCIVVIFRGR